GLDSYEWGRDARRALDASSVEPTLARWVRKENSAIAAVEERLRVLRNMLTSQSHKKEPADSVRGE
ncbi:MAG: hypothetical protein DSY35_05000, partial [Desulfurobacterium sp.]